MIRYLWQHRYQPSCCSMAFAKTWAKRVLTFPGLLKILWHRWALTRRGARVGDNSCIGNARIGGPPRRLSVGTSTFIGTAEIMLHDTVEIGSFVCINDHVMIITATHDVSDPQWRHIKKPVRIGDYAWIATGATLLPGADIGRGAVIGAGAVVSKHIPAYAIVIGNPALILDKRRTTDLNYDPVRFLAFQDAWLGPLPC